jgi:hypothetical protein
MLNESEEPVMADRVEKGPDVAIHDVVHLGPGNPECQRIQRLVLAASGPKPVRKPEEILLVDRIEYCDHGPLDNLVFQRCYPQRPISIPFRNELPPRGQRPIGAALHARMQIHQSNFQGLLVLLPCQAIHSRSRIPLEPGKGRPQHINGHMVQQSGEPLLLLLPCSFSYTFKSRKHTFPARCPARAGPARVPFGPLPLLHRLRPRSSRVVRRLHRYCRGI